MYEDLIDLSPCCLLQIFTQKKLHRPMGCLEVRPKMDRSSATKKNTPKALQNPGPGPGPMGRTVGRI